MQITIEMIETKEFKTKPRGYDPQEVDEFLDAICDEMVRQLDQIAALQQQLAAAKAARPVVEAPTQQVKPIVAAPVKPVPDADFREILEMAQKVKSETIAAAEANTFLISPFVGRILDWYKASTKKEYTKEQDPGVESVKAIFNYYKKFGHKTIVMGASFRSIGEITELAGCDYLTIAPNLLEQLQNSQEAVPKKLEAESAHSLDIKQKSYINDESLFRFDFNEDQMAVEKLREGISKFAADAETLKEIVKEKLIKA
mgnify:CR=1 FL=1